MGEVYFLRGWAYFELSRLFGNVPIIDAPLSPSEVKKVPQSSAREVLDNIVVPDLINAQTMLPLKENMVSANGTSIVLQGRADKMAAEAMLARVYMTLAGFPYYDSDAKILAKKQLEIVLNYSKSNQNKYWAPTLDEWRKQWMPSTDYYNKYSILLFSIVREEQATALCLISVWLYLLPIRIEESLEMKFMWKEFDV